MTNKLVVPSDETIGEEPSQQAVGFPWLKTHQFGGIKVLPGIAVRAKEEYIPHGRVLHPGSEEFEVLLIRCSDLCNSVLEVQRFVCPGSVAGLRLITLAR